MAATCLFEMVAYWRDVCEHTDDVGADDVGADDIALPKTDPYWDDTSLSQFLSADSDPAELGLRDRALRLVLSTRDSLNAWRVERSPVLIAREPGRREVTLENIERLWGYYDTVLLSKAFTDVALEGMVRGKKPNKFHIGQLQLLAHRLGFFKELADGTYGSVRDLASAMDALVKWSHAKPSAAGDLSGLLDLAHVIKPSLIGTRGAAKASDEKALRGWGARLLLDTLPGPFHERDATISDLLSVAGIHVTRDSVKSIREARDR